MRRALVLFTLGVLVAGVASSVRAADKELRITGAVATVEATARVLTVTEDLQGRGESIRFLVAPDAEIRVHGLRGKLGQLKPGDVVTVTWVVRSGGKVATVIQHM